MRFAVTPRKRVTLSGIALSAAFLTLSGCGNSAARFGAPVLPLERNGSGFHLLYSFTGAPDGAGPETALRVVNDTFYGVTRGGGDGFGVAYEFSRSHGEGVLHRFRRFDAGYGPYATPLHYRGTFYGNTTAGGNGACYVQNYYSPGCGTIYSFNGSGQFRTLYRFKGAQNHDGSTPQVSLVEIHGNLYGVTAEGGDSNCNNGLGCGTVFEVTLSGKERVLHSFNGADGEFPTASLVVLNGKMYGTAFTGGIEGNGTVFQVSTAGEFRVIYRFKGGADGSGPWANLIVADGMLYGTTRFGGTGKGCYKNRGCGEIFSMTASGKKRLLYDFDGANSGGNPIAALLYYHSRFYGATASGGSAACYTDEGPGCGTLFSIDKSKAFRVLHRFGGADGASPQGALILHKGLLYGTALAGGDHNDGVIFSLMP